MSSLAFSALLFAALCCWLSSAQSPATGSISLGFRYDFSASSVETGGPEVSFDLHCNPVEQFTTIPSSGGTLTAFQTYVDFSQTTVSGFVRFALYAVSTAGTYTLVAGTDSSSDIAVAPSNVAGPTLVSTTAPLYYPSGSSYTVLPNTNYSLCFINNGGAQYVPGTTTNGSIFMYHWTEGGSSPNVVVIPYYLEQALPNPLVATGTSGSTWQVWMTVSAPVLTWQFAYGLQGALTSATYSGFSVCTVGQFLTAPTQLSTGGYTIYQMYGTRTFTNSTLNVTHNIIGLAPVGTDGNDATLFPTAYPYVDGGGVTYAMDGYATFPGDAATGGDPYYTAANPFVNMYNQSGTGLFYEDGYNVDINNGGYTTQIGTGIVLSAANSASVYSCAALGGAPGSVSSSSTAGVVASSSSAAATGGVTSSSTAAVVSTAASTAATTASSSSAAVAPTSAASPSSSASTPASTASTPSSSTAAPGTVPISTSAASSVRGGWVALFALLAVAALLA